MSSKVPFYLSYWLVGFFIIGASVKAPIFGLLAIIILIIRNIKYVTLNKKAVTPMDTLAQAEEKYDELCKKNAAEELRLQRKAHALQKEINHLKRELDELEEDTFYDFTDVSNSYENFTSQEVKNELVKIQLKEKALIKDKMAVIVFDDEESKKIINAQTKQLLRCFNSEIDTILANTTVKNVDSMRKKVVRTFETLNTLFSIDNVSIADELLDIKLEALNAVYQYQLKLEIEREQRQAIKEQMVEEEKVRREIESAKKKIDKEEHQFKNEVDRLMKYMQKASNDVEKNIYIDKIKELEEKLADLEETRKDVLNREQNTRAGFVYIISNIGSFGENIFKIGMTRRLEPMDRIKELSSASVPFEFDVHAIIFSEDAPGLETTLHQTFKEHQVNKINFRKEFFNIPLEKIEEVVTANHNATVDWTTEAPAIEYRESLKLLGSRSNNIDE